MDLKKRNQGYVQKFGFAVNILSPGDSPRVLAVLYSGQLQGLSNLL